MPDFQLVPVDHDPFAPNHDAALAASMTHWPEGPNPAQPYLDAATRFGTGVRDTLMAGPRLMGDVAEGRLDPNSPEAIRRSADVALNTAGIGVMGAERGAAGIFGGQLAKTADLDALARAQKMAEAGSHPNDIWNQTGWFQGADNKWRFEIPDDAMKHVIKPTDWMPPREEGKPFMAPNLEVAYDKAASQLTPQAPVRVKRLFEHPELARAYPHGLSGSQDHPGIMGMPVQLLEGGNASGALINGDTIALHETLPPGEARSSMLHELQHVVQGREGFAPGSNPNMPLTPGDRETLTDQYMSAFRAKDEAKGIPWRETWENAQKWIDGPGGGRIAYYRQHAGEVEARNVSARMNMTPEERQAKPPWTTEDVPRSQQIVRGGSGGPQMSVDETERGAVGALGGTPLLREGVTYDRAGRPLQTKPLPIGTEPQILQRAEQRLSEGPRVVSRDQQQEILRRNWEEAGAERDYDFDNWRTWDKEAAAWNKAHPDRPINEDRYRFGSVPEFEQMFDEKYLAGKRSPFPGAKKANEYFENDPETFKYTAYTSRRLIPDDLMPPERQTMKREAPGVTAFHGSPEIQKRGENNFLIKSPDNPDNRLAMVVEPDAVRVKTVDVRRANRNAGIGVSLYEKAIAFAAERGLPLRSDVTVTNDALHVYDALRRRGYDVIETPGTTTSAAGKSNEKHVFEVRGIPQRASGAVRLEPVDHDPFADGS